MKEKTKNELPCKYVGFVSTKKLGSMMDERGRWDYTFISFFFSDVCRRYTQAYGAWLNVKNCKYLAALCAVLIS